MAHNIKYRQLKAFKIVAETGSFKVAADRLAITQPSMSIMIKELEEDVGVPLINRTTRSTELTDAGRDFYEQVKGSLDQLEKAYAYAKAAGKAEHGRIRIATLPTLAGSLLSTVIAEYRKQYPKVAIELVERTYLGFIRALRQQEVDFGIGILRSEEPDFEFTQLCTDRLVVVAPKGHPITQKRIGVKTISQYDVVMISVGPQAEALRQLGLEACAKVLVEQPSTAIEIVRKGASLTVTSSSALVGIDKRGLASVPVPGALSYRNIGLLVGKDKKLNPAATKFIEYVQAHIQAGPP
ncbi:LysR family transcriptional regulator [Bordetella bronchiseptica]|uniref:LysR family transcriptional regulator n=1 Tax=Bordetella bronchiseptica TaxID=518 RepID=UPI00045ACDBB|nr:LysR family transcriptional regulator [Bordetella bronchiseptica]AWQ03719.1 LysR family transcriptional regulator [Bordetella bronchiseptica]AZW29210.1 LysR family transcriptional regulator [Bordetella bronchiseptica]KAK53637.1 LysR substrate-binding domain protein [Bordetella bronchiseptica OSU054]KCV45633.1 LysR substrate-binding domain protein [Bordetella bronchiseptica 345]KCV55652.1 LysR substrate-binding domain protein [Bordetella bronchiseptica 7E71]